MKRKLLLIPLFLILAFGIYIFLELVQGSGEPPKDPPLPDPNAYDLLVEFAKGFDKQKLKNVEREFIGFEVEFRDQIEEKWSLKDRLEWFQAEEVQNDLKLLDDLVKTYDSLLKKLPDLLKHESWVPVSYAMISPSMENLLLFRRFTHLLARNGFYQTANSNYAKASEHYVNILKVSRKLFYGGLLVDRLVAQAIYEMGCHRLWLIFNKIDLVKMNLIIKSIEEDISNLSDRDEFKKVGEREKYWASKNLTLFNKLENRLTGGSTEKDIQDNEYRFIMNINLHLLEFAKIAYRKENGAHINSLNDLVPKYLKSIPKDPFGDGPFKLKVSEYGTPIIYSVGQDRVDQGGACECPAKFCLYGNCDAFIRSPQPIFELKDYK